MTDPVCSAGPTVSDVASEPFPVLNTRLPSFELPHLSGHLPALDGLRGIAILMVLIGHFYQKSLIADAFPLAALFLGRIVGFGGYGVQLFFVLSGFLITGILLDTRHQPNSTLNFYARRILRIFPLYYGSLAIVLFVVPHFAPLDDGARLILAKQVWLWTYLANWPGVYVWDDSNVFLLGHFWSLCVEEHFYILWPVVVLLLSKRNLFGLCVALLAFGLLSRCQTLLLGASELSIWAWPTFHKIDGLAIGSAIAIALRAPQLHRFIPTGRIFTVWLFILSAACLTIMWLPRRLHFPIVGVFAETLLVLFFGAVLLYVLRARSSATSYTFITSGALIAFGKYSYGLYVIHGILRPWFATTFDMTQLPQHSILPFCYLLAYYAITIGISFLLAYLSFHLYEKHWLSLKRFFEYRSASKRQIRTS
jgi:peptidoglycan/LPS O-acetylase OafA/YrhL